MLGCAQKLVGRDPADAIHPACLTTSLSPKQVSHEKRWRISREGIGSKTEAAQADVSQSDGSVVPQFQRPSIPKVISPWLGCPFLNPSHVPAICRNDRHAISVGPVNIVGQPLEQGVEVGSILDVTVFKDAFFRRNKPLT